MAEDQELENEPKKESAADEGQLSESVFDEDLTELEASPLDEAHENVLGTNSLEFLYDLELPITVELARKELELQDIINLGEGSIVEFDKLAGENVDVLVNNKKIAEGEVVVIDERFGVRIINLINPAERIKGLEHGI